MKSTLILSVSIIISTLIASYTYIHMNRYEVTKNGFFYIDHWEHKFCISDDTDRLSLLRRWSRGNKDNTHKTIVRSFNYYCAPLWASQIIAPKKSAEAPPKKSAAQILKRLKERKKKRSASVDGN